MVKITSDDKILCLSCGKEGDGVIVDVDERPDLLGEPCSLCNWKPTINDIKREIEESV